MQYQLCHPEGGGVTCLNRFLLANEFTLQTPSRSPIRVGMTLAKKRARRSSPALSIESPIVSDDDGLDINFTPSNTTNHSPDQIEALSDDDSYDQVTEKVDVGQDSDSSSDGDENPVGDIPMRWYHGYEHIGYNRDGQKIIPTNKPSALDLAADRSAWRRVYDEKNDKEVVLTHNELKAIARMRAGRYPVGDVDTENELIAWSGHVMQHPLTSGPEPKRRFLPSRHEARLIVKLVRGMRAGTITRPSEIARNAQHEEGLYQYDVWANFEPKTREEMTKSERARDIMRVPAPKPSLPSHSESYNAPAEYLPSEEEVKQWKESSFEERHTSYLPTKYTSLRQVPLYENFIKERFERCLDLYLAVRVLRDQRRTAPEDLAPDLPSPKELRPFPTDIVSTFGPLPSRARSIDVHPSGQWLLSGSDDACVRLWEVGTGRLQHVWDLSTLVKKIDDIVPPISTISWSPREGAFVFAAAIGYSIVIIGAASAMGIATEETDMTLEPSEHAKPSEKTLDAMEAAGIMWEDRNFAGSGDEGQAGIRNGDDEEGISEGSEGVKCPTVLISHPKPLRTLSWHKRGDYIACVGKDGSGGAVAIHRLTHRSTQIPFKKKTAQVQAVKFHPTRPFFLVATMHHVRIYNLALQQMVKTLKPGVAWISAIDVHPSGDHVLVSSYDMRLCWFDLDLSIRPYKTIRNHDKAVRTAKYHPRLPLFADASDDGSSHVFHGMVYDDLSKNALIVPLKRLSNCSKTVSSLGVLDIAWHPRLPWLFTSGADANIHLLTDCSQG